MHISNGIIVIVIPVHVTKPATNKQNVYGAPKIRYFRTHVGNMHSKITIRAKRAISKTRNVSSYLVRL